MSTRINTNVTAYEAARNLSMNSNNVSKNIERLSTGMRINSAADDAAGLVISQNMKAQLTGLNQATSNTNDAINMVKTAEGALNEVQGLLVSMRQLAVHASNLGVNSAVDVQADQTQITSAIQSINRIASTTQFSSKKLLDGSSTSAMTVTSGSAAVSAGAAMTMVSQGNFSTNNAYTYGTVTLGQASVAGDTFAVAGQALAAGSTYSGSLAINGTTYNLSTTQTSSLSSLNTAIAGSGFQAAVTNGTTLTFQSVNGGPVGAATFNATNFKIAGANGVATTESGVVAGGAGAAGYTTLDTTGGATALDNTSSGANVRLAGAITITNSATTTKTYTLAPGTTVAQLNTQMSTDGLNVSASVTATGQLKFTTGSNNQNVNVTVDSAAGSGHNFSAGNVTTHASNSGTFSDGAYGNMTLDDGSGHTMVSSNVAKVGSNYFYSFANGTVLSSSTAQSTSSTTTLANTGLTGTAGTATSGADLQFQIGGNGGQTSTQTIASVASDQLGKGAASYTDSSGATQSVLTDNVKDINLLTFKGAQDALAVIDKAIADISTTRAGLGAFQSNVLESNIRSLGTASQNLNSSMSTIVDTDLSAEIVDFTKNQILVQAGTSALGQANQAPQAILKLLQ